MKLIRRITALILCVLMMLPTQGIFTLADSMTSTQETIPPDDSPDEAERIDEVLPLDPLNESGGKSSADDSDPVIYWNPGTSMAAELATGSNARKATSSDADRATGANAKAKAGSDRADGKSAATPVKTLEAALERAGRLQEELGITPSDITIYAMNPMEVADGELYVLNVGSMRMASWPGREYDNDTIFYINGGQLTLVNAILDSGEPSDEPENTDLIYMKGGILQMGGKVTVNGRVVMDYESKEAENPWDLATGSDAAAKATRSNAEQRRAAASEAAVFDMDEYILSMDEDSLELIEDKMGESTWRQPIIQLIEGFIAGGETYLLELRGNGADDEVELVESLYADESTEEEFLELFSLSESTDGSWRLATESKSTARVRDTGAGDLARFAALTGLMESEPEASGILTKKSLKATRGVSGTTIYWNPGDQITVSGLTYPGGSDTGNDGNTPEAPVRTWSKALEKANGGTIVSMRSVLLGGAAAEFIGARQTDVAESFLIESTSLETMVTLRVWDAQPQPAFVVPAGETLVLRNVVLEGIDKDGKAVSTQTVLCQQGQVVIDKNVTAETGYIQVDAFKGLKKKPVIANSINAEADGIITLFFGGINNDLSYRYTDVVVPGEALETQTAADPNAMGEALLARFRLDKANRNEENGGHSRFDWYLRQDTNEDDDEVLPQNLELYAEFYFDAVYLDGVRGDDESYGSTCQHPVKYWERAHKIWETEMEKSLAARMAAHNAGKTAQYIEEMYPVPRRIYICGTVMPAKDEHWKLKTYQDYNGTDIVTEVVSHVHPANAEGTSAPVHNLPKTLIVVPAGRNLVIEDIMIRNITDEKDSVTARAEAGGSLKLIGSTGMTGTRAAEGTTAAKDLTFGTHIEVAGGSLELADTWTGYIETREQGIRAFGGSAVVTMDSGEIRKNNSFDRELYHAKSDDQLLGSGVILSGGAKFTMNGGRITENTVYSQGAGVHMTGTSTTFTMNGGEISANKMAVQYEFEGTSANLLGQGIGIYSGVGTKLYLGNGLKAADEVLVTGNAGYYAYGVGVYAEGTEFKVNQAEISKNFTYSNITTYVNRGIGLYVGSSMAFEMDGAVVSGNYSSLTSYGCAQGAGIYLLNSNNNYIKNSTISGNLVGYEYTNSTSYSAGGGLYLDGGSKLTIEDSTFSGNQAYAGGAVYTVNGTLAVSDTAFKSNRAVGRRYTTYGVGGAIYQQGGTVNLNAGVVIGGDTQAEGNYAYQHGGGIYLYGNTLYLNGTSQSNVTVKNNWVESNSGYYGGGIFASGTTYISYADISNNKAPFGAGLYNTGISRINNSRFRSNSGVTGGGIYALGTMYVLKTEVSSNIAATSGGGVYAGGNYAYWRDSSITMNHSGSGGGIHLSNSNNYYLTNVAITGNTADSLGGGVYASGSSSRLYLTETASGGSQLNDNAAGSGGGIYSISGVVYLDIDSPIQNTAAVQGSNLYLKYAGSYITTGRFLQPAGGADNGIYNIYLDIENVPGGSLHSLYFDPSKVTVEKKADQEHPDAVYLNTASSFLSYLQAPPHEVAGTLPLDLNEENFKAGSVVIKPAGLSNLTLPRVNDNATGVENVAKIFTKYTDANENMKYSSGGKLPKRTQLGGYKKNVVIVGEGVYLSGSGNDVLNNGSSPDQAVSTFKRAKEILEKEIDDANDSSANTDGFSPFIYICGNVQILNDETWELDYSDLAGRNPKYIAAEEADGLPVYEAQVRRFASFIDTPMITVGKSDGSSAAKFRAGKLIVNGLSESVIFNDQSDKSPILMISKNSSVFLTGYSRITNNYYSGIDNYGSLFLTGEEQEENKQLLNHQGSYVRSYGSSYVEMDKYSRIVTDGIVTRVGSVAMTGIYGISSDVTVLMKGHSSIDRSMTDGEYGSLLQNGINLSGTKGRIDMQEYAAIKNLSSYGITTSTFGAVTMQDFTSMDNLGGSGIVVNADSNVLMRDEAQIKNLSHGSSAYSAVYANARSKVLLRDKAKIDKAYNGIYSAGADVDIQMQDYAEILNTTYGVFLPNASSLSMNMNEDSKTDDSAKIISASECVYLSGSSGASISMGRRAVISKATSAGIHFNGGTGTAETKILMKDDSVITGSNYGIEFEYRTAFPVSILMKDRAAIEMNNEGIREYPSTTEGITKLQVEMADDSRISGNKTYGIYLLGGVNETNGYYIINMKDQAVIGGDVYYDDSNPRSGNKYAGIYTAAPIQLNMSGSASLSGNGSADNAAQGSATNGLYLYRRLNGSAYYRAGTTKINLNENASISSNRGGVFVTESVKDYPNPCEITLAGAASINNNKDAVYLKSGDQKLELKENAFLGTTTYQADGRSVDTFGPLWLDGRATIDGMIQLRNVSSPITLTRAVTDPAKAYHLWLAEGFLKNIVVQPGDPDGETAEGVKDAAPYLNRFIKEGADGIASDKQLTPKGVNIVLDGENNVYLSGSGLDSNEGNSPATAVRTFKRAKEILETGYFTEGANIVICVSTVQVLDGDGDWSFDDNGRVTNSQTKQTWKPLVIRHKDFSTGRMIALPSNSSSAYAPTVTLKNITIDGGSEHGIVAASGTNSDILFVSYGRTAVLGKDAVLQNNKASYSSLSSNSALGVRVNGGTLEIDGGIIRNMVRETTATSALAYKLASAIYCDSIGAEMPGRVIMKSGQITDNKIDAPYKNGYIHGGAVHISGNNSVMEMSGGLLADNSTITRPDYKTAAYGGGIVSDKGNVTVSGGIIRGNEGGMGSAIYYLSDSIMGSGSLIMSGGQVLGNKSNFSNVQSQGAYSQIYIDGVDFHLRGGGADIRDNIYLNKNNTLIKVSGNMYQIGRLYHVFLNQGSGSTQFCKGSVVVQPDGNWMTDVTPYLSYFQVHSNPYILDPGQVSRAAGTVSGVKENQCLILMQAVYLDSEKGKNTNDGTTPAKAVETFTKAVQLGKSGIGGNDVADYFVIYVSGKATNKGENVWSLPNPAYMNRYTGFPVYQSDGTETPELEHAYNGYLIEPVSDLTLDSIAVYGRRSNDTIISNGDSLLHIKDGIRVKVTQSGTQNTIIARNYNIGEYSDPKTGSIENLGSRGGAIRIEAGGLLELDGGIIRNTDASYGSAIYQEASETQADRFGHLYLAGNPSVTGKVYLAGTGNDTAAYIEAAKEYAPPNPLEVSVGNDYDGRPVILYPGGVVPGYKELECYKFDDAVQALYDITNRFGNENMLELNMRRAIYLDGQNGSLSGDGNTPETAFKTLKQVYESIAGGSMSQGTLVFVVNTVELNASGPDVVLSNILIREANGASHYQGLYQDSTGAAVDVLGQVYFKRYVQPDGYTAGDPAYTGFNRATLMDTLFHVKNGGKLTMNGIYVDGHSQDSAGADVTLVAKGVKAASPLAVVEAGGEMNCSLMDKTEIANGIDTATLFTNNVNTKQKTNVIGTLEGSDIIEASSAGIELLGGKLILQRTEFKNLKLGGNVVSGGTDVYNFGELHFSNKTFFSGSVFLEGFGTAKDTGTHSTSRYMIADQYGEPAQTDFQVLMRDPYNGRDVVYYAPEGSFGPSDNQVGRFRLEERVKDYFYLAKRPGKPYFLELQVPVAVYIDGTNGNDDPGSLTAGSTPSTPVKSMKRAFELLYTRAGNTIYVVDTIKIDNDTQITGTTYKGTDGSIALGSTDKVRITRYIQPDFAYGEGNKQAAIDAGYDVKDFTGVLMNIKGGITVKLGNNVFVDGHSQPKDSEDYAKAARVSRESEAKAPMITVAENGTLELYSGVTLMDNNNTYVAGDGSGLDGGAVHNSGTAFTDGALFSNNRAAKGSAVYQDGTFTIQSAAGNLKNHSFYLTTVNTGTPEAPVWGTDHIIRTMTAIPDGQTFDVDMDNAVKGRDVVKFMDRSAYDTDVDSEHDHFVLGSTVPLNLFLVQSQQDETVLQLQNWEIFDVEVPTDIYLVMHRNSYIGGTARLMGVVGDAAGTDLLNAPEYKITNKSSYDVKVSIRGFENRNDDEGITHDQMNLTGTAAEAVGSKDLYLAVKGLDSSGSDGFAMAETSLSAYANETVTVAPAKMGVLKAGSTGSFAFTGMAGAGFIDKYLDSAFPMTGVSREDVQAYMDGTSGTVNARAMYKLKYRLEMEPSRR